MSTRGRGRGRFIARSQASSRTTITTEDDDTKATSTRASNSIVWNGRASLTDDNDVADNDASIRAYNIVLTNHSLHWYAGKTMALLGPVID
jgi:hypothetical protein